MNWFKRSITGLLSIILVIQMTMGAFAQTANGEIVDSNFSLEDQKSNFDEYSDKDWEETFPLGTFVVEFPQYTVKEGGNSQSSESSDTYLGVNIARFGGKNSRVTLEYMASDVTTTPGDFELTDNKIVFEPGEEMKTVNIKINDNELAQTDRYFAFTLVDAGDAHIGDFNRALVKIVDDELYIPTMLTATAPMVVDKGDDKVIITLRRTQGVEYFFTVDISTADLTGLKNEDYIEVIQTVTFQPKEVEHTIEVPLVHSDIKDEIGKAFKVILSNPKGGEIAGGNSELTIKLTNKVPDPTYIKVNSEKLESELGSNDKSGNTVNNGTSLTDSNVVIDTSTLTTRQKVSTFFSAMSGGSVSQMASYTKWDATDRVITDKKQATNIFKYVWGTDNDYLDDGILDENDRDLGVYTDNNINFNDLYRISINWSNDGTGTNTNTKLKFKNPTKDTTDWEAAWGEGNYKPAWGYYDLNPESTVDGSDDWSNFAGSSAKNRGLEFELSNRGWLVPLNYFFIENMDYYRAVIPFERLVAPGTSWYEITNGIEFSKDGFIYSIVLADSGFGGIGDIVDSAKKGFYINSDLKVLVKSTTEETAQKVPTALYIKDSASNIHNQSLPIGGAGTAFTRTDIGYQTNIKLNTMETATSGALNYNRIISGKYTYMAKKNTETDKYFNIAIDTANIKTVNVIYDSAKELIEQSGSSAEDIIKSIVSFNGLQTMFSGTYSPENYKFGFGEIQYNDLVLNTKPTLLGGKNVNIKILGTAFNESSGTHNLAWDSSYSNAATVTIVLSDPNQKTFDPTPTVSKVGNIIIDDDQFTNFTYHRDMFLASGFTKLRFENIHSADSNGYANGGLIFNINFTDRNLYPPKASDTPTYYKVVVKKVDSTGKSEQELLTFVHEADSTKTGDVLYSEKGSKVSKYEIKRTSKNSYQLAFQSKFDFAQNSQAGQLFIGGENIVVEVYDMDTLQNITNDSSTTKRIKTISNNDTVGILPQMPNDALKTDALNYTTQKQPGQDDFYIYQNDTSTMDLPPFNFDLGTISNAFNTSKIGVGGGIAINGDELTISFSLSGNPIGADDDEPNGIEKLKDTMEKTKTKAQERKNAQAEANKAKLTQKSNAVNPINSNKTTQKATVPSTARAAGSTANNREGSFSLSGGFALTLKYDSVTGSWQFDNMYFMFSIGGGIDKNQPIPACPIFYFHLSASVQLSLATGFQQVPVGYWGGKLNRKIVFAGFNLSPSVYLGIGVGAGISGVLGIEASFYVQAGLSATFGATVVTMGNNIIDFNTNDQDNFELEGNWEQDADQNSYKNSVMVTGEKGASVTYEVDAYQIYIKGNLLENGGIMNISIATQDGTIVDTKTIDTKFTSDVSNVTFYNKHLGARDKYIITISLDEESLDNTEIALDEVDYRTLESNYATETLPATLDSWRFQFGLKLDVYLLIFSFSIDLIYFFVDQDGTGWGYPFTEKRIEKSAKSLTTQDDNLLEDLPRGYNYVESANASKSRSALATENYYDLGDYSENKTLSNLALNVMPTTQAKIYKIGNDTVSLWIIDDLNRTDGDQRQAIVYSINGASANILDNDGTGDTEFAVGENENGELVVVWTSSTGVSNSENANSIDRYKMINDSMEVKTASINLSNGIVSPIIKIGNTADSRQDLLPKYVSKGNKNIVAFVKDEKTQYDSNVQPGYTPSQEDEEQIKLAENFNTIQNAIQTGVHKSYYSIDTGNGYSNAIEIPLNISDNVWRAGSKITSNSIEFIDDNTLIYAFTVEISNSQKGSFTGVERALFVQKGTIGSNGIVDFSEGAICVDKVFDYDASLDEVFRDGNIPAEYMEKVEGTEAGEQANENPIISDVQFEKIGLPDENGGITNKLTLFYKNKSKLVSINEDNLKISVDRNSTEPIVITTVMELKTADYDLNVTQDGGMYILYSGGVDTNEYDTALYIKLYDNVTSTWSEARQLTFNNSYNQSALDNGVDGVYSVNFKKLSSVVSSDGGIDILTMSTSSQFKYEMYTPKGETEEIRLAYLDSTVANRNLDRITYSISDEYVFDGILPDSNTKIHIPSKQSNFYVYAENKGDRAMLGGSVELFFRLANGTDELIEAKTFNNSWVSEKGEAFEFKYTFPANTNDKYNKAKVYYKIKDASGNVAYNSYDQNKTLEINQELPEVIISSDKTEVIRKADGDYISYKALVNNIGFVDVTEQATLTLQLMEYDENNVLQPTGVLLSQVIDPNLLKAGVINNQPINLSLEIKLPANITTSFRAVATITGIENELDKDNNDGSLSILYPSTNIILGYEDRANTIEAIVGEEIILSNFEVISSMYKASDIVFEEVSTNCLSIDNVTNPQEPKIKVMRSSESGYTSVDLTARVKDTTISKTVTINVSKRQIFNFGDDGITLSGFDKLESFDNYKNDIVQSTNKDNYIEFNFKGNMVELYGNKNVAGGNITVNIYDIASGSKVATKTVSTKSDNDEYNISLAVIESLDATKNYRAVITNSSGATIKLDKAEVDGTVLDLPASEAYTIINNKADQLDLPMQNGSQRNGFVSFDFDKDIKLIDGVGDNISNFYLTFDVKGIKNGVETLLPEKFFIFDKIDGETITFKCEALTSDVNYDEVIYTLQDTELMAGFIQATDDSTIKLDIPSDEQTTFKLTESRIEKVEIVDCSLTGKLDKAIVVTFEKSQMEDRLTGTKIMYTLSDGVTSSDVEFVFEKMNNSKQALYTISKKVMDSNVNKLSYTFKNGIVLSNDYALVSQDGNYVDNIITVTNQLSFEYERAKVVSATILRENTNGEKIAAYLTFDKPLDVENISAQDVSLSITQNINNVEKQIPLRYESIDQKRTTIKLSSTDLLNYNSGDNVAYFLDKNADITTTNLISAAQKLVINKKLSLSQDVLFQFSSTAFISDAVLSLADSRFKYQGNIPVVEVIFNTEIDAQTVANTFVTAQITDTDIAGNTTKDITLALKTVQKRFNNDSEAYSVAIYEYDNSTSIDFSDTQLKQSIAITSSHIEGAAGNITNLSGGVIISKDLTFNTNMREVSHGILPAPIIMAISNSNAYNGDWTTSVDVSVETANSSSYQYKVGSGDWMDLSADNLAILNDVNDVFSFRAIDSIGFKGQISSIDIKVDAKTPAFNVIATTGEGELYESGTLTEKDVVFTVEPTSNNISSVDYFYSVDNGVNWGKITNKTFTISETTNKNYKFKAVSQSMLEKISSSNINVNINKPVFTTVSVDTNGYAGNFITGNVNVNLYDGIEDMSMLDKYQFSINKTTWTDAQVGENGICNLVLIDYNTVDKFYFRAVAKSGSTGGDTTGTQINIDKKTPTITVTGNPESPVQQATLKIAQTFGLSGATVTVNGVNLLGTDYGITDNGTYTFVITNGAGISAQQVVTVANIDRQKPVININSNGYTSDNWSNTDVTLNTSNTTNNLGTSKFEYCLNEGAWITYNGNITINTDTINNYKFRVTSQSGIESTPMQITVRRDSTIPTGTVIIGTNTWKQFLNTISFGLFFKDTVKVTVTGADDLSDVQKIETFKSATELTLEQVKLSSWSTYTNEISEEPVDTESFIYYVKITDNAGNVNYISSNGVTFDTTSPTINGIMNDATYYVDQAVIVTDINIDTITVNGIPFVSGSNLSADNNETCVIVVTDKAGNRISYTVYTKTIASIDESVENLTTMNVKSSNETAIEDVLATIDEVLNSTNSRATQSQINELNTIKDNLTNLLDKIQAISDAIADADTKTDGITLDNVKSSDENNLYNALTNINDLLENKSSNLTDIEKSALEQKRAAVLSSLLIVNDIATTIADVNTKTNGITTDNAKSSDKTNLDSSLATLKGLLENKSGNLTDGEKLALEQKKVYISNTLITIIDVANAIAEVNTKISGITSDNVKSSDQHNFNSALATINSLLENKSGNLTANEKLSLEQNKITILSSLLIVSDIANAIADVNTKTNGITIGNAKSSDKTNLDSVLTTVNSLLENKAGNLTASEISALEQKKNAISSALSTVSDIANTIAEVNTKTNGITIDNAKSSDKTNLDSALTTINDLLNNRSGNLIDSEKSTLEQLKVTVSNALSTISGVANSIADANTKVNGITLSNVKSSDQANLDSSLTTINVLLNSKSGNLTDGEKSALELKKSEITNALAKIIDVANAITEASNLIADITNDNFIKDDRINLENTLYEFQTIIADYNDNMTNDEKAQISERIEFIQVIIGSLDNVKSTENDITALPNPVNVTKDDADNINNALNLYNHLTEYQKTLIDANIKTKLNEVTKALSNLLLQDPASGIKVEGVDGTTFDTKTVLSVTSIKDTLDAQTKALFAIGVNNVAKGQEIVQLYDIQLQLNGQAIQPNGKVKITFKLTDEMKNYDNLQVVYIADDGTVTIIPFEQNGDEVSFITDHLSNYGIIGTPVKSNGNLNTGDNSSIVTYAVLGTTALLVIITISKRRRYKVAKKY